MFTPALIFKMWRQVSKRFGLAEEDKGKGKDEDKGKEKAKKPSPKVNLAKTEDTRIEKGLEQLRNIARGDLNKTSTAERFSKSRDRTVKLMKRYCKLVKGNDLKDAVKELGPLRTNVKRLTVAVEALTASPYPPEEDGEPNLALLDKVDTSALDKAMEDPRFGEFSAEELAELDSDEAEGKADVAPREQKEGGPGSIPPREQKEGGPGSIPQPGADPAAEYKRVKAELFPGAFTRAADASPDHKNKMIRLLSLAVKAEKANQFQEGLAQLTQLRALIKEALVAGASAPTNPNAALLEAARKTAEAWTRTRQAARVGVEALQKTLLKTRDGRAIRIASTLETRFKTPTMGVDVALAQLTTALAAGAPASGPAAGLTVAVIACAAVLEDELITHIESNPFSVAVDLKKPLSASLQQVRRLIRT